MVESGRKTIFEMSCLDYLKRYFDSKSSRNTIIFRLGTKYPSPPDLWFSLPNPSYGRLRAFLHCTSVSESVPESLSFGPVHSATSGLVLCCKLFPLSPAEGNRWQYKLCLDSHKLNWPNVGFSNDLFSIFSSNTVLF